MKKVLIADTVFVSNATKSSYEFISVFPSCDRINDSDFKRGYEALKKRAIIQSGYYDETLKKILPVFLNHCIEGKTKYSLFAGLYIKEED